MKVLKATQEALATLNGYTNGVNRLEFVPDADGNMIVGLKVLECEAFSEIREQLDALERIDFNPVVEEPETI